MGDLEVLKVAGVHTMCHVAAWAHPPSSHEQETLRPQIPPRVKLDLERVKSWPPFLKRGPRFILIENVAAPVLVPKKKMKNW